jgi:hypothetical protein
VRARFLGICHLLSGTRALQVHKAQLRRFRRDQLRSLAKRERGLMAELRVGPGDSAWSICNSHGISLAELTAANKQLELDDLQVTSLFEYPSGSGCFLATICCAQALCW